MKDKLGLRNNDIRRYAYDLTCSFISAMFENIDEVQSGEDIEYLHDMRVASRRLREAFQLFELFYGETRLKKTLAKVKKITRALGLPREMDICLDLLQAYEPTGDPAFQATHEYLIEFFELERARLRKKVRKAFRKTNLKTLRPEFLVFAQTVRLKPKRSRLSDQAGHDFELENFLEQTTWVLQKKAAPLLAFRSNVMAAQNDEDLHGLRIAVKKFRYALEICNPLYQNSFEKAIEASKELQELLGKIHDYSVLIERLKSQRDYLLGKSHRRLMEGCQKIVYDLEAMKQSFYPQVEPCYAALLEALSLNLPRGTTPIATVESQVAERKVHPKLV